jgi:hypothetical protein
MPKELFERHNKAYVIYRIKGNSHMIELIVDTLNHAIKIKDQLKTKSKIYGDNDSFEIGLFKIYDLKTYIDEHDECPFDPSNTEENDEFPPDQIENIK